MSKKGRVLVAMSGGIDSTVTALTLHDQGYEVIGITMKTWDYASAGTSKKETGCCSLDSINDARAIAVEKGFPHYIIDIREEFGDHGERSHVGSYKNAMATRAFSDLQQGWAEPNDAAKPGGGTKLL